MMISVPAHKFLWTSHDERLHHFRRYTRRTPVATVGGAGLKVARIRYFSIRCYSLRLR